MKRKSLTLRNMALVTIKRLPGGAVAVTGRKLAGAGRKRNSGGGSANGWVNSDRRAAMDDIRRLGIGKAATYNMGLLRERIADGETQWKGITRAEMLSALRELKSGS